MEESITQQDSLGCSASCIAFVGKINYEQARNILGDNRLKSRGIYIPELLRALSDLGLKYECREYNEDEQPEETIPDNSIVFIRPTRLYRYGHYLVRSNGLWMDSWINYHQYADVSDAISGYRNQLPSPIWFLFTPID